MSEVKWSSDVCGYGDFLADKREERFCQYFAVEGCEECGAWQKAFRDDCALERLDDREARVHSGALLAREDVKARIKRIKAATEGAGALTNAMLTEILERRLMETTRDVGGSSKDKMNTARTMVLLAEAVKRQKGWDKEKADDTVHITMTSAFPAGWEARGGAKGGNASVSMDLTLKRADGAANGAESRVSDDGSDENLPEEE